MKRKRLSLLQKASAAFLFAVMTTCCSAERLGVSPNGKWLLTLASNENSTGLELRLISSKTSNTAAVFPISESTVRTRDITWSDRSDAVAIAVDLGQTNSIVPGFFMTHSGEFAPLLFSDQTGNLAKLGEPKSHWKKIRNFPVKWDNNENDYGDRFLIVKTQVWDASGQRFTVSEPVRVTKDGELPGR